MRLDRIYSVNLDLALERESDWIFRSDICSVNCGNHNLTTKMRAEHILCRTYISSTIMTT